MTSSAHARGPAGGAELRPGVTGGERAGGARGGSAPWSEARSAEHVSARFFRGPDSGPSLLDTTVITVSTLGPAQLEVWLRELAERTWHHRETVARDHDRKALLRERAARLAGLSELVAAERGAWHRKRARGQRERFLRADDCLAGASSRLVISCGECGCFFETAQGCQAALACASCRNARVCAKRGRLSKAMTEALRRAGARGHLDPARPGGRWSEKLFTLTIPHIDPPGTSDASDTDTLIAGRIRLVLGAWRRFRKTLSAWLLAQGRGTIAVDSERNPEVPGVWTRSLEWTPASDGLGHPHMHAWFFGPFLPVDELRRWWGGALERQGVHAGELAELVVDIREVRGAAGVAALEVVKYITKDLVPGGRLAPELYAPVYAAIDGRRVTQSTSGLMGLADADGRGAACGECGAVGKMKARIIRAAQEGEAA